MFSFVSLRDFMSSMEKLNANEKKFDDESIFKFLYDQILNFFLILWTPLNDSIEIIIDWWSTIFKFSHWIVKCDKW